MIPPIEVARTDTKIPRMPNEQSKPSSSVHLARHAIRRTAERLTAGRAGQIRETRSAIGMEHRPHLVRGVSRVLGATSAFRVPGATSVARLLGVLSASRGLGAWSPSHVLGASSATRLLGILHGKGVPVSVSNQPTLRATDNLNWQANIDFTPSSSGTGNSLTLGVFGG